MFDIFKKKCPIYKMELKQEEDYSEGYGKKFCSDECLEEYRKRLTQTQSKSSGGLLPLKLISMVKIIWQKVKQSPESGFKYKKRVG